jgi:outer membrane protein TolC
VLTWPVLDLITVRARSRVETAQVKVADARRLEITQAVEAQLDASRAILDASRRVAENTPIALKAASDAEKQATARYRAGLSTVDEVAEAQRLLAQAEIDDAVARLGVRRAELLLARAAGDLSPFLRELHEGAK